MKISYCLHHGRPRYRVNIQRDGYRKRLYFPTREEALAFARAADTPLRTAVDLPRYAVNPRPSPPRR